MPDAQVVNRTTLWSKLVDDAHGERKYAWPFYAVQWLAILAFSLEAIANWGGAFDTLQLLLMAFLLALTLADLFYLNPLRRPREAAVEGEVPASDLQTHSSGCG